jgi:DNA (cytosine-5)-methyltransferase 1
MVIRIGTDCSGIEAPIQALQQLNIPFQHKWSCEIDKFARQSIEANYKPEKMYLDITKRKHALLPDIDMYVCGFPCTPFSLMGEKKGSADARSNIMYHCIKVIQKKLPKIFILENVKNFKFIEDGGPFHYLLKQLQSIKDNNKSCVYSVYNEVLNTKDYGIPQNRERLFIIGIRKDIQVLDFSTPEKIQTKPLDNFIIDKAIHPRQTTSKVIEEKLKKKNYAGDHICCCDTFSIMNGICPTLTLSGCKYMYHSTYNRYLDYKECLMLQGFPQDFTKVVSDVKMCNQIGNSMSVNVLKAIIEKIFSVTELQI